MSHTILQKQPAEECDCEGRRHADCGRAVQKRRRHRAHEVSIRLIGVCRKHVSFIDTFDLDLWQGAIYAAALDAGSILAEAVGPLRPDPLDIELLPNYSACIEVRRPSQASHATTIGRATRPGEATESPTQDFRTPCNGATHGA